MNIRHSKYKNTGILFELLVRQITADTLDGKDSPVKDLLKKYFVKTELGREYKLYETLLKKTTLTETKANIIVNTLIESSKTLNRGTIKRQKYNFIKEIKDHYNISDNIISRRRYTTDNLIYSINRPVCSIHCWFVYAKIGR